MSIRAYKYVIIKASKQVNIWATKLARAYMELACKNMWEWEHTNMWEHISAKAFKYPRIYASYCPIARTLKLDHQSVQVHEYPTKWAWEHLDIEIWSSKYARVDTSKEVMLNEN